MQRVLNNAPMNVNDEQPNQTVFSHLKFVSSPRGIAPCKPSIISHLIFSVQLLVFKNILFRLK